MYTAQALETLDAVKKARSCPICGDRVRVFATAGQCPRIACTCGLEFQPTRIRTVRLLIEAWNTRAGEDLDG